jgi:hypothetical protein
MFNLETDTVLGRMADTVSIISDGITHWCKATTNEVTTYRIKPVC